MKTVLITGASSGIGLSSTKFFASNGWNVIATMRNPGECEALTASHQILKLKLNVLDPKSVQEAIAVGVQTFQKIDVVVNNAGYAIHGAFEATSGEEMRRQFETNYFGSLNVMKAILPHFRQNKGGRIINVTSVGGRLGLPFYSTYHGSKFALEGFTESLQYELEPFGIIMKIVEPGAIRTDFYQRSLKIVQSDLPEYGSVQARLLDYQTSAIQTNRASEPEVVAKAIHKAATENCRRLRVPAGKDASAILFAQRFLPSGLLRRMVKKSIRMT